MLFKMHNPGACEEVCGSAVCLRSPSNSAWQLENIWRLALFPFLSAPSGQKKPRGCEVMAAWTRFHVRSTCLQVSLRVLMQLPAAEMDDGASRPDLWRKVQKIDAPGVHVRRRGVFTGLLANPTLGGGGGVKHIVFAGKPNEDARCESWRRKPDFHGSSAASLVDPASVTAFMGGLASLATASLKLLQLARQIRPTTLTCRRADARVKAGGENVPRRLKRSLNLHLMWVRPESALNS